MFPIRIWSSYTCNSFGGLVNKEKRNHTDEGHGEIRSEVAEIKGNLIRRNLTEEVRILEPIR
jgi:hypothetical protein